MARYGPITNAEYLMWVKRSSNRLLGESLPLDASKSAQYRTAVKEFQFGYRLPQTGEMNSATQDKMIRANHIDPIYADWVQEALRKAGAGHGVVREGMITNKVRRWIRSFQRSKGLGVDGWVGAKTETVLAKESGIRPPSGIVISVPVRRKRPKRPAPGKPKHDLPAHMLRKRWCKNLKHSIVTDPTLVPDKEERSLKLCVLDKLSKSGTDDAYQVDFRVRQFINASTGDYAYTQGGREEHLDNMANHAIDELDRLINRRKPHYIGDNAESVADLFDDVKELIKGINNGIRVIRQQYALQGNDNAEAVAANAWLKAKQEKKNSILYCFK